MAYKRRGGNKYHARKAVVDGITFDSRKEAERYMVLKEKAEKGANFGLTEAGQIYSYTSPERARSDRTTRRQKARKAPGERVRLYSRFRLHRKRPAGSRGHQGRKTPRIYY